MGCIRQMISSITVGDRELELTVDAGIREGRQELYKNIFVPETLLEIVRDAKNLSGYMSPNFGSTTDRCATSRCHEIARSLKK